MSALPRNYDAWKTGTFGRFERAQERRAEAYSLALSERDSELREDPILLAEAFTDAVDDPAVLSRFQSILEAAAGHKPAAQIGNALTRLVNDIIHADAERHAEEEAR